MDRTAKNKMNIPLIYTCNYRGTEWQTTTDGGKKVELREIWEWAEENLTR
jgi:hypothetical protein